MKNKIICGLIGALLLFMAFTSMVPQTKAHTDKVNVRIYEKDISLTSNQVSTIQSDVEIKPIVSISTNDLDPIENNIEKDYPGNLADGLRGTAYNQGFEGGIMPTGWTIADTGSDTTNEWEVISSTYQNSNSAYNGTYMAGIAYSASGVAADEWLISSEIDLTDVTSPMLRFTDSYEWSSYATDSNYVKVSTTDQSTSSFTDTIDTYTTTDIGDQGNNAWDTKNIDLSAYAGQTIYIAWECVGTWAENWFVDDVFVTGDIQSYHVTDVGELSHTEGDGWHLVSFNTVADGDNYASANSLTEILDDTEYGIPGSYDKVMWYDASNQIWRSYMPSRAQTFNSLSTWDNTMGIWIHMTSTDTLQIEGTVPSSTDVSVYPGWNIVSYPSNKESTGGTPAEITKVGYPEYTQTYNLDYGFDPATFTFLPGEGYLLYNDADYNVIWTVDNDLSAPTVDSTNPTNGATGIFVNTNIEITFSEEMDQTSVESAIGTTPSFTYSTSWNGAGDTITLNPNSDLDSETTYDIDIGTGAQDLVGNGLQSTYSFSFTTEDNTPPTVDSTSPTDSETGVSIGTTIEITFSEEMDQGATESALSMSPSFSYSTSWNGGGDVLTITPDSDLSTYTTYDITVGTGAQDLSGNNLASPYSFSFTTSGSDPVEYYAVLVGISDYESISDLSYCDEDVTDIYNWLTTQWSGETYSIEVYGDGHTTNYPIYTDDAYEDVVDGALYNMFSNADSNDVCVYTTSGHGDGDGSGSSYLCQLACGGGGHGGEDGDYYDTEYDDPIGTSPADTNFIFIDHCYSGGMGPELMALGNAGDIYCCTTCTEDGYGWDDGSNQNGAWTYQYFEWGWVNGNGATDCEGNFVAAHDAYPHSGGDEPQEFDGTSGATYIW